MADYQIVNGDITEQDVDCIVNSWNRNFLPWWLLLPQGVSRAIKKKAGLRPFWELAAMPMIPLGGAVVTSAGRLPYKAIIHVAGINVFWFASRKSIHNSVINAVKAAEHLQVRSAAIPIIGAGSGNYSTERALQIILQTLQEVDTAVRFVVVQYNLNGS